jgi:hypothetical protein
MRPDLSIKTDRDCSDSSGSKNPIVTPINACLPRRLSNYSFKHYLARKPVERTKYMHHSLDFKPLESAPPKTRKSVIDFGKQSKFPATDSKRPSTCPAMYSPNPISRHVSTPDFSRQITREKANFRSRKLSFDIEDRSLARDCPIVLPRKRVTILQSIQHDA